MKSTGQGGAAWLDERVGLSLPNETPSWSPIVLDKRTKHRLEQCLVMSPKNFARDVSHKNPEPAPSAPEQTRPKLLAAAQAVFVEVGFYDATIREICKRAGVNIALVNYHFKDKLGLYIEVLKNTLASAVSALDRVHDPTADPVDLLRNAITVAIRNMSKSDRPFEILMQHEGLRPTPAMAFFVEETTRPAFMAMCTLIGRILQLPAEDQRCRLATHSIYAQVKYFGEQKLLLSQLDPTILAGKTPEEIANFIMDFSLSYLQSEVQRSPLPPTTGDRTASVKRQKSKVDSRL